MVVIKGCVQNMGARVMTVFAVKSCHQVEMNRILV